MTLHADRYDSIKKEFPEHLRRNLGNIAVACEKVKIHRSTFYTWKANDPEFAEACRDVIESLKDRTESLIYKKMFIDEETTMIIFFAKTQMKDRGYVERTETTGKDGGAIEVAQTPLKERNLELIKKAVGE